MDPSSYLWQNGDSEGATGVLISQVDRDLREICPWRFRICPTCQLGPCPEAIRKLWNLDKTDPVRSRD